jgi:hypothetical protein
MKSRVIFAIPSLVAILVAGSIAFCFFNTRQFSGGMAQLQAEKLYGQEKQAILKKFGKPTREWVGHYGRPPEDYLQNHKDAISVTYDYSDGKLYLSFEKRGDDWICFSSDWLPEGAEF